jgi:hypothetical protein
MSKCPGFENVSSTRLLSESPRYRTTRGDPRSASGSARPTLTCKFPVAGARHENQIDGASPITRPVVDLALLTRRVGSVGLVASGTPVQPQRIREVVVRNIGPRSRHPERSNGEYARKNDRERPLLCRRFATEFRRGSHFSHRSRNAPSGPGTHRSIPLPPCNPSRPPLPNRTSWPPPP